MKKLKKRTLVDKFRDAVRAFRGSPIGSVTFGIDVKKCSECDRSSEVLYLCDGKICGDGCMNTDCIHTTDIRHAKNFKKVGDYFWENDGALVEDKSNDSH